MEDTAMNWTYNDAPIVCEECGKTIEEHSGYTTPQGGICSECLPKVDPTESDDHAYERDDRDAAYWRTNQTDLTVELMQHECTPRFMGPDGEMHSPEDFRETDDPTESYVDQVLAMNKPQSPTAEEQEALDIVLASYRDMFGVKLEAANEIHRKACVAVWRMREALQPPTLDDTTLAHRLALVDTDGDEPDYLTCEDDGLE
jgi:hypothetical protein